MRRLSAVTFLALGLTAGAAGGYWYARPHPPAPSTTGGDERSRRGRSHGSLLPRSEWRALLVGHAEEGRQGRDYLPVFEDEEPAFGPGGEIKKASRVSRSAAQDSLLPQSDGAPRHVAGAEKGLDGDGLHPRL